MFSLRSDAQRSRTRLDDTKSEHLRRSHMRSGRLRHMISATWKTYDLDLLEGRTGREMVVGGAAHEAAVTHLGKVA